MHLWHSEIVLTLEQGLPATAPVAGDAVHGWRQRQGAVCCARSEAGAATRSAPKIPDLHASSGVHVHCRAHGMVGPRPDIYQNHVRRGLAHIFGCAAARAIRIRAGRGGRAGIGRSLHCLRARWMAARLAKERFREGALGIRGGMHWKFRLWRELHFWLARRRLRPS